MKKIVINISDSTYEKLRFEAIEEKKSITDILSERIFHKPFSKIVNESFENFVEKEYQHLEV